MTGNKGEFIIEILPDGKIKATAPGEFAPEIHASADELMKLMETMAGGAAEAKPIQGHGKGQMHTHADGTTHQHH